VQLVDGEFEAGFASGGVPNSGVHLSIYTFTPYLKEINKLALFTYGRSTTLVVGFGEVGRD